MRMGYTTQTEITCTIRRRFQISGMFSESSFCAMSKDMRRKGRKLKVKALTYKVVHKIESLPTTINFMK